MSSISRLHDLFFSILERITFSDNWVKPILLQIIKKDCRKVRKNRGNSLIDIASKIFRVLLLNRFATVGGDRT